MASRSSAASERRPSAGAAGVRAGSSTRCSGSISSPSARIAPRSRAFSSSRTFPGQGADRSCGCAAGARRRSRRPGASPMRTSSVSTSRGISFRRSRSGGRRTGKTARRWKRSSRTRPASIAACRSRLVAAIQRTLAAMVWVPPTRSKRRSWVHHQDARHRGRRSGNHDAELRATTGMGPGSDRPSCSSAIRRATASPSPVPYTRVVWKGSKSRSGSPGGSRTPVAGCPSRSRPPMLLPRRRASCGRRSPRDRTSSTSLRTPHRRGQLPHDGRRVPRRCDGAAR
jgi:hypothetical protein